MTTAEEWDAEMLAYVKARNAGETLVAAQHLARAKVLAATMRKDAAADVALVENIGGFFDAAVVKPAELVSKTAGELATSASKKLGEIGVNLSAPILLVGGVVALVLFASKK